MQFKWNGHLIPPTKTEIAWNRWLTQRRDDTVTLLIYEYGLGIPSARALEELKYARIRPQHTDRSGAAAEASIREIVAKLQEVWGETYQGSAMAWRMWANEVMWNLDRSTWEVDIYNPPTATVERLLRAADGEADIHLANLSRSARLALDVVNGAIADNRQLKNDWEAFGRRLDNQENALRSRRDTLEGFLEDIPIPPVTDVIDPTPAVENVPDTKHEP
ncbi:uncharacterized protein PITG_03747 [Phytophthora infestans T30-4]|uniref:Uncharacterized protein n=1 Tax=Phytophthora infestans (strain T30-4) TaxID=403677 RepID=D0MYE6_PHYIT|nr:uncharacterized protein PITG_03747 [Phytophthora infestans T30-4]EEY66194.1 conserved hypothetical protein [Phytophthora infestans T30-4]|eukprot:XP_002906793.1 conserved hypothetical protein [Phytophthora infestans T30-4]